MPDAEENNKLSSIALRHVPRDLALSTLFMQFIYYIIPITFFAFIHLGVLPTPKNELSSYTFLEGTVFLLSWISLFLVAAACSSLGIFVSFVSRTDVHDDRIIRNIDQRAVSLSINVFGTIFGFLMVLLFLGGFIGGNLFPALSYNGLGFRDLYFQMTHVQNVAKLCVWTFIAGFSERLIPRVLENFASQVEEQSIAKHED